MKPKKAARLHQKTDVDNREYEYKKHMPLQLTELFFLLRKMHLNTCAPKSYVTVKRRTVNGE